MTGETLTLTQEGGVRQRIAVQDLEVPDVRPIALFLGPPRDAQLFYVYRTCLDLRSKILARDPDNRVRRALRVDVPDLGPSARLLPKEECHLVLEVAHILRALVRHLMPKARQRSYTCGTTFEGKFWYTPE